MAVSASRPSVMYSGRAGMVRRTERPSSLMVFVVPPGSLLLTRRNADADRRRSRVRILLALGALAQAQGELEPAAAALDREVGDLARAEVCDDSRNVLRAGDALPVDRHDHVAAAREFEPERGRELPARPQPRLRSRATGDDVRHDGPTLHRVAEALGERRREVGRLDA